MMSQTSSNVDANVNPGYAEIHIEKCTDDDVGLLDGWEHWSLEDIIRTIESMKKAKAERGNMEDMEKFHYIWVKSPLISF